MTSELVDPWRKDGRIVEMKVYELLGRHPRIVAYHGHDPVTFELLLQRLPNGCLDRYLPQHPEVPFQNRLAWAIEIAQGIAYLHSKDVVWNDTHLGNVLVTDDLHVVLCDFGGSYINPVHSQLFDSGPPLPYVCPSGYTGLTIKRQDIFGFGVILFVLLSKRYPHCPTRGFAPPAQELIQTFNFHHKLNFDILPDAIYPRFAQIVINCFNIFYQSAAELLLDLEEAYSLWIQEFEKVCSLFVRYPAMTHQEVTGRCPGS
jgi:serine/threonine protein kinase